MTLEDRKYLDAGATPQPIVDTPTSRYWTGEHGLGWAAGVDAALHALRLVMLTEANATPGEAEYVIGRVYGKL